MASESTPSTKSKVVAGVLAILLGGLGVHKFYLGNVRAGIIHLVLTLLIITAPISGIVALIEGILYLTKSDEDFHNTYVVQRKAWF